MSILKMIDIPPVWLAVAAAIAWWQAEVMPLALSATPSLNIIGTLLVALGCVMIGLAAWEFHKHKTTIIPHLQPNAMISSGIFGISRNPIYLADAVILFGLCLRWGAYPSLFLVPVFLVFIQKRFVEAEEMRLKTHFGENFDEYAQKVRRWV